MGRSEIRCQEPRNYLPVLWGSGFRTDRPSPEPSEEHSPAGCLISDPRVCRNRFLLKLPRWWCFVTAALTSPRRHPTAGVSEGEGAALATGDRRWWPWRGREEGWSVSRRGRCVGRGPERRRETHKLKAHLQVTPVTSSDCNEIRAKDRLSSRASGSSEREDLSTLSGHRRGGLASRTLRCPSQYPQTQQWNDRALRHRPRALLSSRVRLSSAPWTAAHRAPLSSTISQSLLRIMSSDSQCHPTISSSVIPLSSCPQSFPASGPFPVSQLFASGGQSIGASASAPALPSSECSGLISFRTDWNT